MIIQYHYKLVGIEEIRTVNMRKIEYFDSILDGENYEDDAIPKYDDPREYIPETENRLFEWDELIISDSIKNDRTIRTEYFAEGNSLFASRKDKNGYESVIQSILISPNKIYISKMERIGTNKPWTNTNFSLGVNVDGGREEKWYNLKKGELIN